MSAVVKWEEEVFVRARICIDPWKRKKKNQTFQRSHSLLGTAL